MLLCLYHTRLHTDGCTDVGFSVLAQGHYQVWFDEAKNQTAANSPLLLLSHCHSHENRILLLLPITSVQKQVHLVVVITGR